MHARFVFLVIAFVVFLAEAEIDIVVPSFPGLMSYYGISVAQTEQVLSFNLIAHGVAGLIVGWLADVWGKHRTLLAGLLLFLIGSLFTVLAKDFYWLLLGRALQGAGMAAPMVVGYLLVMDDVGELEKARRVALLNGVANISLALTPALGSLLAVFLGWRANFQVLLLLALLALLLVVLLVPRDARLTGFAPTLTVGKTGYCDLLQDVTLHRLILATIFLPAGWFAFVGFAPVLYVNALGVSLGTYGFHQGVIALLYGVVSLYLFRIAEWLGKRLTVLLSVGLLLLAIVGLSIAFFVSKVTPVLVTSLLLMGSIGSAFFVNRTQVLAVSYRPEAGGKVSAMITLGRWLVAAILLQVSGMLYEYHNLVILLSIAMIWLFGLVYLYWCADDILNRMLN